MFVINANNNSAKWNWWLFSWNSAVFFRWPTVKNISWTYDTNIISKIWSLSFQWFFFVPNNVNDFQQLSTPTQWVSHFCYTEQWQNATAWPYTKNANQRFVFYWNLVNWTKLKKFNFVWNAYYSYQRRSTSSSIYNAAFNVLVKINVLKFNWSIETVATHTETVANRIFNIGSWSNWNIDEYYPISFSVNLNDYIIWDYDTIYIEFEETATLNINYNVEPGVRIGCWLSSQSWVWDWPVLSLIF